MHQIILIPHEIDSEKLAVVTEEMKALGAPVVRVADCGDYLMALEGCHRLTAAANLGIKPVLVVLDQDDPVEGLDTEVFEDLQEELGRTPTAGEVAGALYSTNAPVLRLEDDGRVAP